MIVNSTFYPTTSSEKTKKTGSASLASESLSIDNSGASFQDVLVLNQTALRAMAIDAMVAESSTGSVVPDAVNAASVMQFRSTLASHIVAPVPEDDWDGGAPQVAKLGRSLSSIKNVTSYAVKEGALKCSEELNAYFKEASDTYGVDEKLLKSIAFAESNFNPNATSKAGAMGIMQMMPATAAECGVTNPYDPRQSIMGGAKYISSMIGRYNGNTSLALAAYNAGPGNVDKYNGVPPFEETQNYVNKVLAYYNA